jgi:ankyrin repeat protein
LLAQNNFKQTAWHLTARKGKVEIFDKLWEWAKEVLKRDDLNNKLLLAQDYNKETVLHVALCSGNKQVLEAIRKLAKEQLTPGKLNKFVSPSYLLENQLSPDSRRRHTRDCQIL